MTFMLYRSKHPEACIYELLCSDFVLHKVLINEGVSCKTKFKILKCIPEFCPMTYPYHLAYLGNFVMPFPIYSDRKLQFGKFVPFHLSMLNDIVGPSTERFLQNLVICSSPYQLGEEIFHPLYSEYL